jgi:hypothetical protein
MPIHDWTRVSAGTFHDFHLSWIVALRNALNCRLLPDNCYAQANQDAANHSDPSYETAEPLIGLDELDAYVRKQNTLVIHHSSDDRVIALIEIVSPGNKAKKTSVPRAHRQSPRCFVSRNPSFAH